MSLICLPAELLTAIFASQINKVGVHGTTRLRLVCKKFDACILQAIHAHLELEPGDEPHITGLDYQMGEVMTARLILAKMETGNADQRPLCVAIDRAAEYLEYESSGRVAHATYAKALATAASRAMWISSIVRALSPSPDSKIPYDEDETTQNALIATICTENVDLLRSLLQKVHGFSGKTRYFGELLPVAASMGSQSMTQLILNSVDSKNIQVPSVKEYRMKAFVAAVANGQMSFVFLFLRRPGFVTNPSLMYDESIRVAIKNKHNTLAIFLLRCRKNLESSLYLEDTFWEGLTPLAALSGKVSIVEYLHKHTPISPETLTKSIEIACQHGFTEIVRILLPSYSIHFPWYGDAFYWAGRRGNKEILNMLLERRPTPISSNLLTVMAGAAGSLDIDMFVYALGKHPVLSQTGKHELLEIASSRNLQDVVSLFAKKAYQSSEAQEHSLPALDISTTTIALDTSQPPPSASVNNDPQFRSALNVARIAAEGSPEQVHQILWGTNSQHASLPSHAAGLLRAHFYAACNSQPGILAYLFDCSQKFDFRVNENVTSAAVFQVYLDYGWDINALDSSTKRPALSYVLHDEYLTKWFLDYGADPNVEYKEGMTVLSIAASDNQCSVSTIRLLLQYCSSVSKGSPLHRAIHRPHAGGRLDTKFELVELFVEFGCGVNEWGEVKPGDAGTPMHYAVRNDRPDIVRYLLEKGADPLLLDSYGRPAINLIRPRLRNESAMHRALAPWLPATVG